MAAVRYQKRERAEKLARFLTLLSNGARVNMAAAEAGLDRRTLYRLRAKDSGFKARWQRALALGRHEAPAPDVPVDPLEAEAHRRAVLGVEKPVYRGGAVVGHTREYSDSMLMFLLKAKYPEKYGGLAGKPAETNTADIAGALDAIRRKLDQKSA